MAEGGLDFFCQIYIPCGAPRKLLREISSLRGSLFVQVFRFCVGNLLYLGFVVYSSLSF